MKSVDSKHICREFEKCGSIRGTAVSCAVSEHRVRKILSTQGYVINDIHKTILDLHDDHFSPEEIAKIIGLSASVVRSYLPAVRPIYNENISDNAKRIKACRARKRVMQAIAEVYNERMDKEIKELEREITDEV